MQLVRSLLSYHSSSIMFFDFSSFLQSAFTIPSWVKIFFTISCQMIKLFYPLNCSTLNDKFFDDDAIQPKVYNLSLIPHVGKNSCRSDNTGRTEIMDCTNTHDGGM
ncbi:hypothetical protein Nepgr_014615 [Nepenthes gracilis]|uniref:Uncharacterized protein n=1 Tax=Nepenthes gracilis TaxID=150966 RepID=A0AAD3SL48_NEPGR|nr:hypothetical protein Nepgr_014615 [Nepenthes gracilis]